MNKFIKNTTSIFKGLCVVGKHLFKPSVTEEYPEEKPILNNRFRGHHKLFDCKGCGFCKKVCPTNAIIIKKNEEKFRFFIDLGKCIFCGNCEYYCPSKAMKMTNTFESPYTNKTNQIIELENNRKV